jgi:hypothetical protein
MSRLSVVLVTVLAIGSNGRAVLAQGSTSAPLAKQLVTAMAAGGLDAIAARDPSSPDRAIAALVFPGSQLLVVSARYPDANLDAELATHLYRDVYTVLQQPTVAAGKVFFEDLGCDGLISGPGSADVMYEDGNTQTIFDGDWKKQKLSQTAYEQRVKEADARYAQLLAALVSAAQGYHRQQ